jgi:hypothetical protein
MVGRKPKWGNINKPNNNYMRMINWKILIPLSDNLNRKKER